MKDALKSLLSFSAKPWLPAALVLVTLLLIRFWPMLAQGKTMYFADNFSLMVPGKVFTAQWLRQGILPLWNPYVMAGLPWIGDINQSVLYPSTLAFMWLLPALAVNVTIISHLILAFAGMYLLAKRWTAGHLGASLAAAGLWTLSTQVSGSINNLSTLQGIVWIPWLCWAAISLGKSRSSSVVFAGLVTVQLLAGYPQHVLYGVVLAVLVSAYWWWRQRSETTNLVQLWRPWLVSWIVTAIVSITLSAFVWLPFVEVLLDSTRMLQTTAQAAVGSLHPAMLIKIISPYFFDHGQAGMKWGPAWSGQPNVLLYVTWTGLAAIGWVWAHGQTRHADDWFLGGLSISSLVFSLGSYIPGFEVLQNLIPLFRISRNPSMVLLVTNIVVIIWVASAISRIASSKTRAKIKATYWQLWLKVLGAMIIVTCLLALIVRTQFAGVWQLVDQVVGGRLSRGQFHTLERDAVIAKVVSESLVVATLATAAALWAISQRRWTALAIILSLDMLYHTQAMFFFAPATIYPQSTHVGYSPLSSWPAAQDPQGRWLTRNSNQPYTDYASYTEAMVVRAPFSDSFVDEAELQTTIHAQRLRQGFTPNWNMSEQVPMLHGFTTLVPASFAALWNQDEDIGINFIDRVELDNPLLAEWAVKYYLVDSWFKTEPLETESEIVMARQDTWQLYQRPALSRFRFADDTPVSLSAVTETPNSLELRFSNDTNSSQLRIADRYDQNWLAWVNDQPVSIENSREMRLIPIVAGANVVKLSYIPAWFWVGVMISLTSGSLVLFWLLKTQLAKKV